MALLPALFAQQRAENVLVVVNRDSAISRTIAEYYALKREIPLANICPIRASTDEEIERQEYDTRIVKPIASFILSHQLREKILYIVLTTGVPLRIRGSGEQFESTVASVDSELTLLYSDIRGRPHRLPGFIPNPFFTQSAKEFKHPDFPIYLVTRLTGYDFPDVKGMVDRGLLARNEGKFVLDLEANDDKPGNQWLREAASLLPRDRVVLDESAHVLLHEKNVIGYASWGSNDHARTQRHLGFQWLPGAIMTEFVSTNARTFTRPPENWTLGNWADPKTWFVGSPQSMTADYIHDGVTGASGHVWEPYLQLCPRPNYLLPAYYKGRNLAESYYLAIPGLSWENVVIGDPLCSIGRPAK